MLEIIVVIQSSAIALLGYYTYVAHRELASQRHQIDWVSNEIYALKSQIKSVYLSEMGAKVHAAKKRIASKSPTTKPRKDKQ